MLLALASTIWLAITQTTHFISSWIKMFQDIKNISWIISHLLKAFCSFYSCRILSSMKSKFKNLDLDIQWNYWSHQTHAPFPHHFKSIYLLGLSSTRHWIYFSHVHTEWSQLHSQQSSHGTRDRSDRRQTWNRRLMK